MPISSCAILPRVPPICPRADNRDRRMYNALFTCGCRGKHTAKISCPQQTECEVARSEVIESGLESRQIRAHDVQFKFIQSSGAGSCAEIDFSARVRLFLSDSCGEIQNSHQVPQCGNPFT